MLLTKHFFNKKQSSSFRGALRASGVMAFAGLGDALLYPVLPVYGKDLGFSVFFIGVLLSVNRFIRIIANTYIANLVKRVGMKKILIITSSLAVITTLTYGLKLGFVVFLIARIIWGLSYSGLKIATLNYASIVDHKKGLIFGLSQSIKSLGALAVLWFGPILIDNYGIQKGLILISVISLFGVYLAYTLPYISEKNTNEKVRARTTFHPSSINLLVFILAISIDGILVVTLAYLLGSYSISSGELLILIAFYLFLKRLFVILFSFLGGIISIRYSPPKLFILAAFGCLVSLFLITIKVTILGIIIAFLCNTIVVTFSPLVAIKQQKNALQSISSISTWWDLGAAFGAFIGIYAIELLGEQNLYLSLLIAGTILFINYYIKNAKSSHSII